MCIIIAKKSGIEMPDRALLQRCFNKHPHGAGYMVRNDQGKIAIHKGFETFSSMYDFLKLVEKQDEVVIHFRWATKGIKSPANAHPFPLTDNLKLLGSELCITDVAMAHNGTIDIPILDDNLSDTKVFTSNILAHPKIKKKLIEGDDNVFDLIRLSAPSNRFAIMTETDIHLVGDGWVEENGVHYSNKTYEVVNVDFNYNQGHYSQEDWYKDYDNKYARGHGKRYDKCCMCHKRAFGQIMLGFSGTSDHVCYPCNSDYNEKYRKEYNESQDKERADTSAVRHFRK